MPVSFHLNSTLAARAVLAKRVAPRPVLMIIQIASWGGAILLLFVSLLAALEGPSPLAENALGGFLVLLGGGASASLWLLFIKYLEDHDTPAVLKDTLGLIEKGEVNLADWFNYELFEVLHRRNIAPEKTSRELLAALIPTTSAGFILGRLGVSRKDLARRMENGSESDASTPVANILLTATQLALKHGHEKIGVGDTLSALARGNAVFSKFLFDFELEPEDVENVSQWFETMTARRNEAQKFWLYENLMRVPGIGKAWAASYTITLDKFSQDLTEEAEKTTGRNLVLIGHDDEIEAIERVLASSGEKNVLIIGDPGSGRKTVVHGLAHLVAEGKVLPQLEYKRVLELDLNALLAGAETVNEMQERLITIFNEAVKAKNVILVIDEFDNFIGKAFAPGKIDISGIIAQYLESKYFQIIGISDFGGFHRYLEQNAVIMRSFERVEVKEPDINETIMILEDIVPILEHEHRVLITYQALRDITQKAARYIQDVAMPEKAISLLDEVAVYVSSGEKQKVVIPEHIDKVLSQKTGIPLGKMGKMEKEKLLNLEEVLHQNLINQEEAVKAVASAMRRARTGLAGEKRPAGSFLFLGPTGVGKTQTAKALAKAYFENEERMIRFDMSEFQQVRDLDRLIGSFETNDPGVLANAIREKPFSLLLFDEIEKAHPNILNLFLQVLDEGFFTDAFGKRVNCRNNIIITTSNAGANLIRELVGKNENSALVHEKILDFIQSEGIFRPEFLNRFDAIIVFEPLGEEHLLEVARLMLEDFARRLSEKDIGFVITDGLKKRVVELGYNPEFGARPMRRIIQDRIEDLISKRILEGKIKRGDRVELEPEEIA